MKSLWSDEGVAWLETIHRARTFYAFDFDGTLAPITERPDEVQLSAETKNFLGQLTRRATTAILSGRALSDLASRVPYPAIRLAGNHGAERQPPLPTEPLARQLCRDWRDSLIETSRTWPPDHGIWIEDKGLSLSLHYRQAPDPEKVELFLRRVVPTLSPAPDALFGKRVLNLTPPGAADKGSAFLDFLNDSACEQALYIGDDSNDESVFALGDPRVLDVRVGYSDSSRARFYLESQTDVVSLLQLLARKPA